MTGVQTCALPISRIRIDAGSVELSALDYGDPGQAAGPPVVLLHGHADLAWSMHPLAVALADQHHVVSVDLRGHGHSGHAGAYSVLHYVSDLRATVRALRFEHPIAIAHSLGGHVAAQWAGLYPDVPSALILIEGLGPPSRNTSRLPPADATLARAMVELLGTQITHRPLADVEAAAARLCHVHPYLDPRWARFLAGHGTCPGPEGGVVWRFDPRTRDWIASVDHAENERRWAAVTCPVLAVTGADSWDRWWSDRQSPVALAQGRVRLTEAELDARIGIFSNAEHVVIPDAGHMIHFDQPERLVNVVTSFVERCA